MSDLARSWLLLLEIYRPALTVRSYRRLVPLAVGWILTAGTHAVTQALVVTQLAGRRHHEAFHRFFSRGTWDPDDLGRCLFERLLRWCPETIGVVVDDTIATKKGPHVFGLGTHLDAVRSTRRVRVFCFGHCWVTLAVRVRLPFSTRCWALPVLFRLYRTKRECAEKKDPYRKKTELARELIEVVSRWAPGRRIEVAADSAYCNDTVARVLTGSIVLVGAMRPDAVLTALPAVVAARRAGRPRVRGARLPTPAQLAADPQTPWRRASLSLYGRCQRLLYKECRAQWYRACGTRLLRVVVVKVATGNIRWRVFFSTDSSMTACEILQAYAERWQIEVTFRDLKQLFGFSHSSARRRAAVESTAPFVGLIYSSLVIWFADHAHHRAVAAHLERPWYRHKSGHSFSDILRAARLSLSTIPPRVLDPGRRHSNLRNRLDASRRAPARRLACTA